MLKTSLALLVLSTALLSIPGCGSNRQGTEPIATPPSTTATQLSIAPSPPFVVGGGQALTILSPEVELWNAVKGSHLIVTGTIIDERFDEETFESGNVTTKFINRIYALSIEKVIKGNPSSNEVLIKTDGAAEYAVPPLPYGDYFQIADKVLVILYRPAGKVYYFPLSGGYWKQSNAMPDTAYQEAFGRIIQVMKINKIPIALPEEEWPLLPAVRDPLTDRVVSTDIIVEGTITGQRYELIAVGPKSYIDSLKTGNTTTKFDGYIINADNVTPGKLANTIFTLEVDKVIKGDPTTKEVFIRLPGGYITGEIYQGPTEGYFRISDQMLVGLLREDDNIFKLPRVFWIQGSATTGTPLKEVVGRIIQIMKVNNLPIALLESEWPPLIDLAAPARPPQSPQK